MKNLSKLKKIQKVRNLEKLKDLTTPKNFHDLNYDWEKYKKEKGEENDE